MNKKLTLGLIILLILIIIIPIFTPILKNIFNNKIIEGATPTTTTPTTPSTTTPTPTTPTTPIPTPSSCSRTGTTPISIHDAYMCLLGQFKDQIDDITAKLKNTLGKTLYGEIITEKHLPIDGATLSIPAFNPDILTNTSTPPKALTDALKTTMLPTDAFNGAETLIPTLLIESLIANLESNNLLPKILTQNISGLSELSYLSNKT